MKISNHSYGYPRGWGTRVVNGIPYWAWYCDTSISASEDFQYGFYNDHSQKVDQICYTAKGYLPIFAAANERGGQGTAPPSQPVGHYAWNGSVWEPVFDATRPNDYDNTTGGYDTMGDYAVAKNVLTISAVEDIPAGYNSASGGSQVVLSSFSSIGPVDDGRVKPDLAANGVQLTSTGVSSTNNYYVSSGTSMAAPSVTGSAALLIERYTQQYGAANELLASTIKAILCHSADEAGSTVGPDYQFGWGLMNTASAISLMDADFASGGKLTHIKQVELKNGDFVEFTVNALGGQPLKVSAVWTDPAGAIPTAALDANVAALVYDLDLRLINGSTTHYPWKLDPANPTAAATNAGDNARDNVEQVEITTPTAGQSYTVRLTHKGTLKDDTGAPAPQLVSLVLTGVQDAPALDYRVTSITKVAGQNQHDITWNSVVGGCYQLETSLDLSAGSWTLLPTVHSATKENTTARVDYNPAEPKRFWRVKRTK